MTTATFKAAQAAQEAAAQATEERRTLIFARLKADADASLRAADKSFDNARKAEERLRTIAPKLLEARAGAALAKGDDARATLAADLELQQKDAKDQASDARARATRRRREATLAAAILELREMLEEKGNHD
jgi:hypothetical protein